MAMEESVKSETEFKQGWEQVRQGVKCHYPDCKKKSESAAYHGIPFCKEHFDLAQFIAFVCFKSHEEVMHNDQLAPK